MRLLNTRTFAVTEFNDDSDLPPYAILSHVWGKPEDEVTFADLQDLKQARKRAGWVKVEQFCALARQNDLGWAWDDTCCIDKSSSAELSQAINSMYAWYSEARVCYAYLLDVDDPGRADPAAEDSSFRKSRWFQRGWTLQELIAPKVVFLYSKHWKPLGSKASLSAVIKEITNVDCAVLMHERLLDDVSIARRMSWAAARETTKLEDRAYSLMGIFGVNMPAIYGEGDRAFIRLQQEIIRQSPDQSIFAWGTPREYQTFLDNDNALIDEPRWAADYRCLLASSPDRFAGSENIVPFPVDTFPQYTHRDISIDVPEYTSTNHGIQIHLPLFLLPDRGIGFALLACKDTMSGHVVALLVRRMHPTPNRFFVGMYTETTWPAEQFGWHPLMRMFLLPPGCRAAGISVLEHVVLTRVYLQSHNANPQRSREQGIAANELIHHKPKGGRARAQPERFAFVIHGWLLQKLAKLKFQVVGWSVPDAKLIGWTPRVLWRQDDRVGLTLTLVNPALKEPPESPDGRPACQAAVLFRRPPENATEPDALVAGKSDEYVGHELVRSLLACFTETTDEEVMRQGYAIANWKDGTYKHETASPGGVRVVKVALARWLTRDEDVWRDKQATMRYTVGLEVDFGPGLQLRASTEKEKVASLSGLSVIVTR